MSSCRFCRTSLTHEFLDLVNAPPSNAFLKAEQLQDTEAYFPLKLYVCEKCFLVQVDEHKNAREIFSSDYVYFSSFSKTWLDHCQKYTKDMTARFGLNEKSKIVEIASNDGYLLQYFKEKGFSVLGIEPTKSTADVAKSKGIDTWVKFFGKNTAAEIVKDYGRCDLMAANNVLAHVPDIHDFVGGIAIALAEEGVFTAEFPHLYQLVRQHQFDTVYHEHFSYFSLLTIRQIFAAHGLRVFDVEELPTHGGSLRVYVDRGAGHDESPRLLEVAEREKSAGMGRLDFYANFQVAADKVKNEFVKFLIDAKAAGKKVIGYGAAAKGNTLMNYGGVKPDLMTFVVDASPHKQGLYLPGSHIPVVNIDKMKSFKPDYIVILPWNLRAEVEEQLKYAREWGAKFVVAVPSLEIF